MASSSMSPEEMRARLLAIHLEMGALLGVNVAVDFRETAPPSRWQRLRGFFGV